MFSWQIWGKSNFREFEATTQFLCAFLFTSFSVSNTKINYSTLNLYLSISLSWLGFSHKKLRAIAHCQRERSKFVVSCGIIVQMCLHVVNHKDDLIQVLSTGNCRMWAWVVQGCNNSTLLGALSWQFRNRSWRQRRDKNTLMRLRWTTNGD